MWHILPVIDSNSYHAHRNDRCHITITHCHWHCRRLLQLAIHCLPCPCSTTSIRTHLQHDVLLYNWTRLVTTASTNHNWKVNERKRCGRAEPAILPHPRPRRRRALVPGVRLASSNHQTFVFLPDSRCRNSALASTECWWVRVQCIWTSGSGGKVSELPPPGRRPSS